MLDAVRLLESFSCRSIEAIGHGNQNYSAETTVAFVKFFFIQQMVQDTTSPPGLNALLAQLLSCSAPLSLNSSLAQMRPKSFTPSHIQQ